MISPPPRVEPLGGNRYRLVESYQYDWTKEGIGYRIIVPAAFECDLASVPRFLWLWVSPFDLGSAVIPHDWIYAHGGLLPYGSHLQQAGERISDVGRPWKRSEADRLFGRMLREARIPPLRRRRAFRAVRLLKRGSWLAPAAGGGEVAAAGVGPA